MCNLNFLVNEFFVESKSSKTLNLYIGKNTVLIHFEILPCPAVDVAAKVDGIAVAEVDVVATVVFVAVVGSEIVDTEVT